VTCRDRIGERPGPELLYPFRNGIRRGTLEVSEIVGGPAWFWSWERGFSIRRSLAATAKRFAVELDCPFLQFLKSWTVEFGGLDNHGSGSRDWPDSRKVRSCFMGGASRRDLQGGGQGRACPASCGITKKPLSSPSLSHLRPSFFVGGFLTSFSIVCIVTIVRLSHPRSLHTRLTLAGPSSMYHYCHYPLFAIDTRTTHSPNHPRPFQSPHSKVPGSD
jgi:hypothetical protein